MSKIELRISLNRAKVGKKGICGVYTDDAPIRTAASLVSQTFWEEAARARSAVSNELLIGLQEVCCRTSSRRSGEIRSDGCG